MNPPEDDSIVGHLSTPPEAPPANPGKPDVSVTTEVFGTKDNPMTAPVRVDVTFSEGPKRNSVFFDRLKSVVEEAGLDFAMVLGGALYENADALAQAGVPPEDLIDIFRRHIRENLGEELMELVRKGQALKN